MRIALLLLSHFTYYTLTKLENPEVVQDISQTFQHQHQNRFLLENVSVVLIMRSYAGHGRKFSRHLYPSIQRFVDINKFPVIAVLDHESPKDYKFGQELQQLNFTVFYEPKPIGDVLLTRPNGNKGTFQYQASHYLPS
jgi:hypothetical protein